MSDCATPQTAAQQAPPSLGFSRQEHWIGLPFPSPGMKVKRESDVAQSVSSRDPMDCSLPGSSVHGIFQARILEWVASGQTSIPLKATYISILTHGPFIIKASRVGLSLSDKRFNYLLFLINSRHFANMMKLLLLIILSLVKSVAYKNVDLLKYFLFMPPPCKNTV